MWSDVIRAAKSIIYPNRCPFCGEIIGMWEYYCDECGVMVNRVESGRAEPPAGVSELFVCCNYIGRARKAVLRLKNGSYIYPAETMGVMLTELIGEKIHEYDALVPVPSSLESLIERGYVPAEEVAREISRRSGVRMRKLLRAASDKQEQKSLSAGERMENARRSFAAAKGARADGMRLLIIDDVCTTGATLSVCADLLRGTGAAEVSAAVFAVTLRGKKT